MSSKYQLLQSTDLEHHTPPSYRSGRSSASSSPDHAESPLPPYPSQCPEEEYDEDDDDDVEGRLLRRTRDPLPAFDSDPRFRQPTPSPYARAALVFFVVFLFWWAFSLRKNLWFIALSAGGVSETNPDEWGL